MKDDGWDCEAYGPKGREHGSLCFVSPHGKRACWSADECAVVVAGERRQMARRRRFEGGDPIVEWLAGEVTDPSRLLRAGGGSDGE